jgi:hypothetical protein
MVNMYQHRPSHGPAGAQSNHHETHRSDTAHHQARGHRSPLDAEAAFPKPGSATISRPEDFASGQVKRDPLGTIPATNRRAGVTTISGQRGPVGTPRDQGRS